VNEADDPAPPPLSQPGVNAWAYHRLRREGPQTVLGTRRPTLPSPQSPGYSSSARDASASPITDSHVRSVNSETSSGMCSLCQYCYSSSGTGGRSNTFPPCDSRNSFTVRDSTSSRILSRSTRKNSLRLAASVLLTRCLCSSRCSAVSSVGTSSHEIIICTSNGNGTEGL